MASWRDLGISLGAVIAFAIMVWGTRWLASVSFETMAHAVRLLAAT
jgi:hypothetical protein